MSVAVVFAYLIRLIDDLSARKYSNLRPTEDDEEIYCDSERRSFPRTERLITFGKSVGRRKLLAFQLPLTLGSFSIIIIQLFPNKGYIIGQFLQIARTEAPVAGPWRV